MELHELKSGNLFWKAEVATPGRAVLVKEMKSTSSETIDICLSYENFQKSISDVWEIKEDDEINIRSHNDNVKSKIIKFKNLLKSSNLNLNLLKNLSWSGIPISAKAETWRILLGYAPGCLELRENILNQKRNEYLSFIEKYYYPGIKDEKYQSTYRQIYVDIPRMSPNLNIFRQRIVQDMFERILFIWFLKQPECGYVQGINDLATPFFIVFLQDMLPDNINIYDINIERLDENKRSIIEADTYWCFCKFLEAVQDIYIFPHLTIKKRIHQLRNLIKRIDIKLHNHLEKNDIQYVQFSFRWMNNLLTRELPLKCIIRLWDTYISEIDTFNTFQLFICTAFLLQWRKYLLYANDFPNLMLTLQNLPTQDWTYTHIDILVAEAYVLKCIFADAPSHFES